MRALLLVPLLVCATLASAGHAAEPATLKIREVKVLIVAGLDYRAYFNDWKERAGEVVQGASRRFEREFGIRLTVAEYRAWNYTGGRSPKGPDQSLEQLHLVDPGKLDLVIAFTLVTYGGPEPGAEIRGFTQPFGRYVVVPDQWTISGAQTRLIHEVCHVFGAFHDNEPRSVMRPVFAGTPRDFDFSRSTREIIAATRELRLAEGVSAVSDETARMIRAQYQAHHHPREAADRDPITLGYQWAADWAEKSGNKLRADALRAKGASFSTGSEAKTDSRPTSP